MHGVIKAGTFVQYIYETDAVSFMMGEGLEDKNEGPPARLYYHELSCLDQQESSHNSFKIYI